MGIKQDAWDARVADFDAGRSAYEAARGALLGAWANFNTFLTAFLAGASITQAEWDTKVLALRQATITKGPSFEDSVLVRLPEIQPSHFSTLSPLLAALDNLSALAEVYATDNTVPSNVRARLRQIEFSDNAEYIAYTPGAISYQVRSATNRKVRTLVGQSPHWWLVPNQYSDLILRGRAEPRVSDDPANARLKVANITPSIIDTNLFAVRDQCAAVTGID